MEWKEKEGRNRYVPIYRERERERERAMAWTVVFKVLWPY
jgi:hypothetical protein